MISGTELTHYVSQNNYSVNHAKQDTYEEPINFSLESKSNYNYTKNDRISSRYAHHDDEDIKNKPDGNKKLDKFIDFIKDKIKSIYDKLYS